MSDHRAVIQALLGSGGPYERAQRLHAHYLNDAHFHAIVDQLAAMLPVWIDATAVECVKAAAARAEQIAASERMPLSPEVIAALEGRVVTGWEDVLGPLVEP